MYLCKNGQTLCTHTLKCCLVAVKICLKPVLEGVNIVLGVSLYMYACVCVCCVKKLCSVVYLYAYACMSLCLHVSM